MKEEQENSLIESIKGAIPEAFLSSSKSFDFLNISIRKESVTEVISYLYKHEYAFCFLTDLCGVHWPNDKGAELEVVYQLHSLTNNFRLRIKTRTSLSNPEVPSITHIFKGANWMERETYDFFGIQFTGHPNLKRILNVDDMLIFPMRKEFPLEDQTRLDKNNAQFGR